MMKLCFCDPCRLSYTDLSNGIHSNCDYLVVNLFGYVLINDLLDHGVYLVWGDLIVDRLGNHGKDFGD